MRQTIPRLLCLVAGAETLDLARELAGNSNLYIRIHQPDDAKAAAWRAELASSGFRERLGIAGREFGPSHYGSCLLN